MRISDWSSDVCSSDLSSSRSSSRSRSLIAALILEADESGGPLGHALFPCVGRTDGREPPAFLLALDCPDGKLLGFFRAKAGPAGGYGGGALFQAFLGAGLGEHRIGLRTGIDPVDDGDGKFVQVHRAFANGFDERR